MLLAATLTLPVWSAIVGSVGLVVGSGTLGRASGWLAKVATVEKLKPHFATQDQHAALRKDTDDRFLRMESEQVKPMQGQIEVLRALIGAVARVDSTVASLKDDVGDLSGKMSEVAERCASLEGEVRGQGRRRDRTPSEG